MSRSNVGSSRNTCLLMEKCTGSGGPQKWFTLWRPFGTRGLVWQRVELEREHRERAGQGALCRCFNAFPYGTTSAFVSSTVKKKCRRYIVAQLICILNSSNSFYFESKTWQIVPRPPLKRARENAIALEQYQKSRWLGLPVWFFSPKRGWGSVVFSSCRGLCSPFRILNQSKIVKTNHFRLGPVAPLCEEGFFVWVCLLVRQNGRKRPLIFECDN
jgi:hypothetical protein